ncbi:MAG: hypothetical protein ACE14T_05330 [Syntrophales bacterium]
MPTRDTGGSVIVAQGTPGRPKGFIEAVSQIERYYELEMQGGEIPAGMFTTQNKVEFWEVGFISTIWSGIASILLAPFAIGVIERMIPVFGGDEPELFDKVLVFFLAISFSAGYAAFLGRLGKYYAGQYTKAMIRSFLSGIILSAILKIFVSLVFFHFLALFAMDPHRLVGFLLAFEKWVPAGKLESAYLFLLGFRHVLLISAWFVMLSTLIYVAVPVVSIGIRIGKDRAIRRKGGIKI